METLASILAGQGANPYQTTAGISPLIAQQLLAQQMGPAQLGGAMPQAQPMMPQGQPQMPNAQTGGQLGSLAAAALPYTAISA